MIETLAISGYRSLRNLAVGAAESRYGRQRYGEIQPLPCFAAAGGCGAQYRGFIPCARGQIDNGKNLKNGRVEIGDELDAGYIEFDELFIAGEKQVDACGGRAGQMNCVGNFELFSSAQEAERPNRPCVKR